MIAEYVELFVTDPHEFVSRQVSFVVFYEVIAIETNTNPALLVQIEASKALRFLIELDSSETTLTPVLPQILAEYFRIMNEIGKAKIYTCELIGLIYRLITKFNNEMQ